MKVISKVLLILQIVLIVVCFSAQLGYGIRCVFGTWSAKTLQEYNNYYKLSYVLLINLVWYILPIIFAIFGLVKVDHHKDPNNYLLAGFLTLIFANLIAGVVMVVDASDEKVEAAEEALLEEIYGHDDCCCCHHEHEEECECECHDHDEKCECEECSKEEAKAEEPVQEEVKAEEPKVEEVKPEEVAQEAKVEEPVQTEEVKPEEQAQPQEENNQ